MASNPKDQVNQCRVEIAKMSVALEELKTSCEKLADLLDGFGSFDLVEYLEENNLPALALYAKEDRNGRK